MFSVLSLSDTPTPIRCALPLLENGSDHDAFIALTVFELQDHIFSYYLSHRLFLLFTRIHVECAQ